MFWALCALAALFAIGSGAAFYRAWQAHETTDDGGPF